MSEKAEPKTQNLLPKSFTKTLLDNMHKVFDDVESGELADNAEYYLVDVIQNGVEGLVVKLQKQKRDAEDKALGYVAQFRDGKMDSKQYELRRKASFFGGKALAFDEVLARLGVEEIVESVELDYSDFPEGKEVTVLKLKENKKP